jgi:2-polyprenyl-3-methyl-5-hydroxy-6-metoxy-1,4-benzoquinol methylase
MSDRSAARYTLKPDRYSSHARIAEWLIADRSRRALQTEYAVLDIGCAAGFLGHWLSAPDFFLMGVDHDQSALDQTPAVYRQKILADIEALPVLQLERRPNALVLADVLEHTRDAATVLTTLCRQYLQAGTAVIVSLPNVAHIFVRLSLLFGRFNYAERGILDRTHLHFYTLSTARALCVQSGIQIRQVAATPTPLPLINRNFAEGRPLYGLHVLNAAAARWFKRLLGYQFIFFGEYRP